MITSEAWFVTALFLGHSVAEWMSPSPVGWKLAWRALIRAIVWALLLAPVASLGLAGRALLMIVAQSLLDLFEARSASAGSAGTRLSWALQPRAHVVLAVFRLLLPLVLFLVTPRPLTFLMGASNLGPLAPLAGIDWVAGGIGLSAYRWAIAGGSPLVRVVLSSSGVPPLPASGVEVRSLGARIGQLERAIIVTLVLVGQAGAIGFVMGAKALARFQELDQRPFAEYFLVGTLASAAWALMVSALAAHLLSLWT